jgi:uracil-DNA glycosylase
MEPLVVIYLGLTVFFLIVCAIILHDKIVDRRERKECRTRTSGQATENRQGTMLRQVLAELEGLPSDASYSQINAVLDRAAFQTAPPGSAMNGPSGVALDELYLKPLGLTRQNAWLCDLLPQSRMNPGQEQAVRTRYNPVAQVLDLPAATIPPVPNRFATETRVKEILEEFISSGADTLITLGDVPLKEFVAPLRLCDKTSIASFGNQAGQYGQRHRFSLRGRSFYLLPLVHPRQAARLGAHNPSLADAHERWVVNPE